MLRELFQNWPEKKTAILFLITGFCLSLLPETIVYGAKRRGDWTLLWKVPAMGTVYYSVEISGKKEQNGVRFYFSDKSWKKRGVHGEVIEEHFIPCDTAHINHHQIRHVLDVHVRDYIKNKTSLSHHVEWIYKDYEIFSEYLNRIEEQLIQSKNGENAVAAIDYNMKAHQTELYALQQSLKKHAVHKSDKQLKVRREIEQIMLLFPEIRKDEEYAHILGYYWNHMLKRLKHEKFLTRIVNYTTPVVFALGLSSIAVVGTSGAVLVPLVITGTVAGGIVGTTQVGLAIHKWRNVEKLGKISKRFLKFDERVRNLLAHLIEKSDKSHEEFSAMNYLEELHEFNMKREALFEELIRSRFENRIRFAGGVLELMACLSTVESLAFPDGAMHHLAASLSKEHHGLWAALSHNLFETLSVTVNGVDIQHHANNDMKKHDRWKHVKKKLRKALEGDHTDDYDPLVRPKL